MSDAVVQEGLVKHLLRDLTEVKDWHIKNIHRGESSEEKGKDAKGRLSFHTHVEQKGQ